MFAFLFKTVLTNTFFFFKVSPALGLKFDTGCRVVSTCRNAVRVELQSRNRQSHVIIGSGPDIPQ